MTSRRSLDIIQDVAQIIETTIKDKEKKPIIYVVGNKSDKEIKKRSEQRRSN